MQNKGKRTRTPSLTESSSLEKINFKITFTYTKLMLQNGGSHAWLKERNLNETNMNLSNKSTNTTIIQL